MVSRATFKKLSEGLLHNKSTKHQAKSANGTDLNTVVEADLCGSAMEFIKVGFGPLVWVSQFCVANQQDHATKAPF